MQNEITFFIFFKWNVYSAALRISSSLHDSLTSNHFPSGQGNLTQILPFFLGPRIFMKKFSPVLNFEEWVDINAWQKEKMAMEDGIWRDSWEQATLNAKEQIIIKVVYFLERKK